MTLWILDTDHLSLQQRGNSLLDARLKQVPTEALAITIISVEEQLYGRLNQIRRAQTTEVMAFAYDGLQKAIRRFQSIQVLSFNAEAARLYQGFIDQKIRIGTHDLKIAAITLANAGVLLTRNHKDFSKVSNLLTEDWTLQATDRS
jgi:tRNA(fMet)-specific endonuclease VapC